MNFKHIFAAAFLLLLCSLPPALHAGVYRSVRVSLSSWAVLGISSEQGIDLVLRDSSYVWSSVKGDIVIPVADVRSWTFSTEPGTAEWSGASDILAPGSPTLSFVDGRVCVSGLAPGSRVSLIGIDGRHVAEFSQSPVCEFSVSSLPAGLYIVAVNGGAHAFKILKK